MAHINLFIYNSIRLSKRSNMITNSASFLSFNILLFIFDINLPGPEKTQILTRENTLEKKCIIMRFIYPFKRVLKHFFKI